MYTRIIQKVEKEKVLFKTSISSGVIEKAVN